MLGGKLLQWLYKMTVLGVYLRRLRVIGAEYDKIAFEFAYHLPAVILIHFLLLIGDITGHHVAEVKTVAGLARLAFFKFGAEYPASAVKQPLLRHILEPFLDGRYIARFKWYNAFYILTHFRLLPPRLLCTV